ncbi:MAG: hypothetical protein AB1793_04115 [Candidatus Thermoplasmatota archaeon]
METEGSSDGACHCRDRRLLLVVGLGMALFIAGFLISVASLSGPGTVPAEETSYLASESASDGQPLSLFMGLLLSLAGVVLATAAPAVFFIHARNGSA